MAKTKQPQAKREPELFLRGVYFRHYEDLLETAGENRVVKRFAYEAGRSDSYNKRTNRLMQEFNNLDLQGSAIRDYAEGVLNSFEKDINKALERTLRKDFLSKKDELRLADLKQIKAKITHAYGKIDSYKTEVEPVMTFSREEMDTIKPSRSATIQEVQALVAPVNDYVQPILPKSRFRIVKAIAGATVALALTAATVGILSSCKKPQQNQDKVASDQISLLTSNYNRLVTENGIAQVENDIRLRAFSNDLARANSTIERYIENTSELMDYKKVLTENYIALSNNFNNFKLQTQVDKLEAEKESLSKRLELISIINSKDASSTNVQTNLKAASVVSSPFSNYEFQTPTKEKADLELKLRTKMRDKMAELDSRNIISNEKGLVREVLEDFDQYRKYSTVYGNARSPAFNFVKAKRSTAGAGSSLVSTLTGSYGNNKFKDVRNDDLSIVKSGGGFFSSVRKFFKDIGGPISNKKDYEELNPLTGLVNWGGDLVVNAVGIGKNTANVATIGLANNIIDPAFDTTKEIVETGKHLVQGTLNTTRVVAMPLAPRSEEVANQIFDWSYNVPTEFASNVAEGEGFSNAQDIQTSINIKGNTGVIAEFLASGYLLGRSVSKSFDNEGRSTQTGGDNGGPGAGHNTGTDIGGPGGTTP